jgi:hypothetical protein
MSPNLFKTGQAEPLRYRRILRPPILRRFSGGNDAAMPTAIRWTIRRMAGGITEIHPPDHPAKLTVNLWATAGRLTARCLASARQTYRTFPPHCQRPSADITAAGSGYSPVSFPSYDRH